jgi:hypothetical protein
MEELGMSVDRDARPSFQESRKAAGVVGMGVTQHDRVEGSDLHARTLKIVEEHRAAGPGVEQEASSVVGLDEEGETMLTPERRRRLN